MDLAPEIIALVVRTFPCVYPYLGERAREIYVAKHLPGQHDQSTHGRGGDYTGKLENYHSSLTEAEGNALTNWGSSSYTYRMMSAGVTPEGSSAVVVSQYDDFVSAIDKAPVYDGKIERGLNGVPLDVAEGQWQDGAVIEINSYQSATKLGGQEFIAGNSAPDKIDTLWVVDKNISGKDISLETGSRSGRLKYEGEVVMTPGTKYKIMSRDFITSDGKKWGKELADWFFEGTEYNLNNLPAGWSPGKEWRGGKYIYHLREVGK